MDPKGKDARFRVGKRDHYGVPTLVTDDEQGNEVPVMHLLPGDVPFPADEDKLLENLASLLNGEEPPHRLEIGNRRLFWRMTPEGPAFAVQELDEPAD